MTFICDDKKFIFLEPPKTATGSINQCLWRTEKNHLRLGFLRPDKPNRHSFAHLVECSFWGRWQNYYKFSTIRNPWARYVSWMMWSLAKLKELNEGNINNPRFKVSINRIKNWITEATEKDEDMLTQIIVRLPQQHLYWTDKSEENVIVDKLLRFENIQQEWTELGKKLGIKDTKLSYLNKSDKYDYREFYTDETIQMVAEKDAKVIEIGGYTFD